MSASNPAEAPATLQWNPRRIVTGIGEDGLARISSIDAGAGPIDLAGPGSTRFYNLWKTTPGLRVPLALDGEDPVADFTDMTRIFPGADGTNLTISVWPANYPPEEALPMWMHATDTVDYIIILSGQITAFLDSGDKVTLGVGDCLIQNGTNHAWRNEGAVDCVMAAVAVGAERA